MNAIWNSVKNVAYKILTVLADRRFWMVSVPVVIDTLFGMPETEITPYLQSLYVVLAPIVLSIMWTIRRPTGPRLDVLSEFVNRQ